jgi:PAS domain-containing protein
MRYARLETRLPEQLPLGNDLGQEPAALESPAKGRDLLDSIPQTVSGDKGPNEAQARKQVQELAALADGERRRLHAVLENLPVGVVMVAANGAVSLMNREAERLLGRRSMLGKNVLESEPDYLIYTPRGEPISPDEWPLVRSLRNGEVLRDIEGRAKHKYEPFEMGLT